MRARSPAPRLAVLALALLGPTVFGVTVVAAAKHHPPARMLVYAQEWSLWPSRSSVPAGRVTVQLWNRGQDAHDLRIRRLNRHGQPVGKAQTVKVTESGLINQATWRVRAGKYLIYCSLPQHRKRGMHTRLVVGGDAR